MRIKTGILFCILLLASIALIVTYQSCNFDLSVCSALYETQWEPKWTFSKEKIKRYLNNLWPNAPEKFKEQRRSHDENKDHTSKPHPFVDLNKMDGNTMKINLNKLKQTITDTSKQFNTQGNELNSTNDNNQAKKLNDQDSIKSRGMDTNLQEVRNRKLNNNKGIMKFNRVSCLPVYPDVLLFNRIFKTGSTSLGEVLVNASELLHYHVQKWSTEDWYNTGDSHPYPDVIERHAITNQSVAFVAHFYFRPDLEIDRPFTYINIVRDPVRRIISHYKYMRIANIRPADRVREMKDSGQWNESLLTCIRKQHRGCEDNVMTRFFCGLHSFCKTGSKKALEKAKFNMQRYYAAVGILDRIDIFLKILKKRLPSFFNQKHLMLKHWKENKNKDYYKDVKKKVLKKILVRNKADLQLYEFSKKIFYDEVKACGL